MSAPAPTGRHAVMRREIDDSERPIVVKGRPLAYDSPALARAIASGYGESARVRDTGGEP